MAGRQWADWFWEWSILFFSQTPPILFCFQNGIAFSQILSWQDSLECSVLFPLLLSTWCVMNQYSRWSSTQSWNFKQYKHLNNLIIGFHLLLEIRLGLLRACLILYCQNPSPSMISGGTSAYQWHIEDFCVSEILPARPNWTLSRWINYWIPISTSLNWVV